MFYDGHSDPVEGTDEREKTDTRERKKHKEWDLQESQVVGPQTPAWDQIGEGDGLGAELSVILTEEVQVKFLLRQRVEGEGLWELLGEKTEMRNLKSHLREMERSLLDTELCWVSVPCEEGSWRPGFWRT